MWSWNPISCARSLHRATCRARVRRPASNRCRAPFRCRRMDRAGRGRCSRSRQAARARHQDLNRCPTKYRCGRCTPPNRRPGRSATRLRLWPMNSALARLLRRAAPPLSPGRSRLSRVSRQSRNRTSNSTPNRRARSKQPRSSFRPLRPLPLRLPLRPRRPIKASRIWQAASKPLCASRVRRPRAAAPAGRAAASGGGVRTGQSDRYTASPAAPASSERAEARAHRGKAEPGQDRPLR